MSNAYGLEEVASSNKDLEKLRAQWRSGLVRPEDGMWTSIRGEAKHVAIIHATKIVGYAAIGYEEIEYKDRLLQFFLLPAYRAQALDIFKELTSQYKITKGLAGTNNPIFLSTILHYAKAVSIHTYLFQYQFESAIPDKLGTLKQCTPEELGKLVDFYHFSMQAPESWLTGYLGALIDVGAVFYLEHKEEIRGACEVRISNTAPEFADIGIVVSPNNRKQGYGTFMLNQAKSIALDWGKRPICSCEKENIGSLKSIQNCGFVSDYQLLSIDF